MGKKEEIFTVLGGKSFLKKGGGAKTSYFGQIFTPVNLDPDTIDTFFQKKK